MKNSLLWILLLILSHSSFTLAAEVPDDIRQPHRNELTLDKLPKLYSPASTGEAGTVDMLVFYQPSYATKYGKYQIHRRIEEYIEYTNSSMASHGFEGHIRVVDIVPVVSVPDTLQYRSYEDENGEWVTGADSLWHRRTMNEVDEQGDLNPEYELYHLIRKADLTLYAREARPEDEGGILGLAGIGGETASFLDNDRPSSTRNTVAHEIGHNFGMRHEYEDANVHEPEYAHAWQCGGESTIMYSAGGSRPHYSDPDKTHGGDPCGDAETAHNARLIGENWTAIANRREGVPSDGEVRFAQSSFSGNEASGVDITLTRTGSLAQAATVKVFAENGSAAWGEDFTHTFVLAEFEAGEDTTTVTYPMVADNDAEDTESFGLSLKYPYRLSVGGTGVAAVTLADGGSSGPVGQFDITGPDMGEEGDTLTFTLTRTGGEAEAVLNVQTQDIDTTTGSDYTALNEQLVFEAGEVEKTVSITLVDDIKFEPNEQFSIELSSPSSGAEFVTTTHSVTIVASDVGGSGEVSMSAPSSVTEGGSMVVTLSREGGFAATSLTLTATVGSTSDEYPVDLAVGDDSATVTVNVPDNSTEEADYTMELELSSDDADLVFTNATASVTVNDNDASTGGGSNGGGSSGGSDSGGGSFPLTLLGLSLGVAWWRRKTRV